MHIGSALVRLAHATSVPPFSLVPHRTLAPLAGRQHTDTLLPDGFAHRVPHLVEGGFRPCGRSGYRYRHSEAPSIGVFVMSSQKVGAGKQEQPKPAAKPAQPAAKPAQPQPGKPQQTPQKPGMKPKA